MQNPVASASLYVGDLLSDVTEGILFDIFSQIGQVTLIRVCRDAMTKRSLGYAYVNFLNREDAETALKKLNNVPIKGRPCRVMWSQRDPSLRKSGLGNLFVKNLAKNISGKDLYDVFSGYGNVLSCKLALDSSNTSKGFGFVQYETQEMAIKAMESLNNTATLSDNLIVQRYIPRMERIREDKFTNIFIKNLDDDVTEESLEQVFGKFGKIQNLALMKDTEGHSKCFAFVNYFDHEAALKAIETTNSQALKDGGKVVYVGKALRKEERSRMLQQIRRNSGNASGAQGSNSNAASHPSSLNLYVKNLEDDVTNERLAQEFGYYGELISARVMRDETDGKSRGFGFVWFKNSEDGMKALNEMNGKILVSQPLFVDLAKKREGRRSNYYYSNNGNNTGNNNSNNSNNNNYYSNNASNKSSNNQGNKGRQGSGRYGNSGSRQQRRSGHFSDSGNRKNRNNNTQQRNTTQKREEEEEVAVAATTATTPSENATRAKQEQEQQEQPQEQQQEQEQEMMQKNQLGERLYNIVLGKNEEFAPKITGMLMENRTVEQLEELLGDEQELNKQIQEAQQALESFLREQSNNDNENKNEAEN